MTGADVTLFDFQPSDNGSCKGFAVRLHRQPQPGRDAEDVFVVGVHPTLVTLKEFMLHEKTHPQARVFVPCVLSEAHWGRAARMLSKSMVALASGGAEATVQHRFSPKQLPSLLCDIGGRIVADLVSFFALQSTGTASPVNTCAEVRMRLQLLVLQLQLLHKALQQNPEVLALFYAVLHFVARMVLCCAVLSCVMLLFVSCCAVSCCAVTYIACLCCVVLCCVVLCCAVLCCAVLCCAVLCCVVLCCVVLWCGVVWCGVVWCGVVWCVVVRCVCVCVCVRVRVRVVFCCVVLCCVVVWCGVLCCVAFCCVVLCCVLLCCVVLCCVVLCWAGLGWVELGCVGLGWVVLCWGLLCCVCVGSCRVVSCRVVSCRVVSCRVVSCRVVSCRVVSCCCVVWCAVLRPFAMRVSTALIRLRQLPAAHSSPFCLFLYRRSRRPWSPCSPFCVRRTPQPPVDALYCPMCTQTTCCRWWHWCVSSRRTPSHQSSAGHTRPSANVSWERRPGECSSGSGTSQTKTLPVSCRPTGGRSPSAGRPPPWHCGVGCSFTAK